MSLDLAAALRRQLLQRFPADRDYPRAALRAAGMPPLIGTFLARTLDRWVEIERAQIRSDWFDFASPDVQQAEEQFFDALARTARVPAEAWKGTLGGTVDLVVRYLTTPARALTDAIFEGSADPLSADAVRARLPMFDAYPYFAEVGGAYLERKRTESLEPPDLFGLLDRIDRRVVSEFGPDEWVDLLAPLFALARQVPEFDGVPASLLKRFFEMKGEPGLAMPLGKYAGSALDEEALRALIATVLLEEGGDPVAVAPVRTNGHTPPAAPETVEPSATDAESTDADSIDAEPDVREEAEDVVETEPDRAEENSGGEGRSGSQRRKSDGDEPCRSRARRGRIDVEPDGVEPEVAEEASLGSAPTVDAEEDAPSSEPDDAWGGEEEEGGEDGGDAVPLWQRFAAGNDANVNAQFGGAEAPADAEEATGAEPDGAPLWKRFFGRPDERPSPLPLTPESKPEPESVAAERPARASSLEELERRVLGASTSAQRTRFVKHLFGGDAGKYATVLHALDGIGSWTEASQIIARDVFRPFRINIYGEHAVAFTDAVEARFRT